MRKTYITATAIALLTAIWLGSGQLGDDDTVAEHATLAAINSRNAAAIEDKIPTRVRARVIRASLQTHDVRLRGRTQNKRTVEVRAETRGRVVERPIERGDRVAEGHVLCRISLEDRQARLSQSIEAVNQARIEYQGSLKLQSRGFQSETAIATAKANLASAQAALKASELDLARTFVRAPFDGRVEQTHAEVGDYLQGGAICATIVDLDPMLLVGRVSEKEVQRLRLGEIVTGRLSSGETVHGPITFIGQQSDSTTRTYPVEVTLPNPDFALRSGISTEIVIPVETVLAHKISPALFALNDAGEIGVRTVDADNRVQFHLVEVVREDEDGVWISGLPQITTLITVGQELVVPGEIVETQIDHGIELDREMPASTRPQAQPTTTRSEDDAEAADYAAGPQKDRG